MSNPSGCRTDPKSMSPDFRSFGALEENDAVVGACRAGARSNDLRIVSP
jgi:hypothetical protein